ncbi:MAG: NAD(P)H-hydrate dehydratase [Alteraurantiacibacter sp.]
MTFHRQVLTAAQMQAAEQTLIDGGQAVEMLMERAGRGAADWVWRLCAGRPVTVLCGPGNNGGDGYVIARVLAEREVEVTVVAPLEPKTDAAKASRAAWGGETVERGRGEVLVDCLFGTGIKRGLSRDLLGLLCELERQHELLVAVDLPSGVESDTGGTFGVRLPTYDLTIALGAWKRAHWLMPASALMGERRLVEIGPLSFDADTGVELADKAKLSLPEADAHKYSRGALLVIGGEMPGASLLAARAAQHGGAGYVSWWCEHSHPSLPADLVHREGALEEALGDERLDAILVGPGLGRGDAARTILSQVLDRSLPIVLDADALVLLERNMLSDGSKVLATPHAGELARLCQTFDIVENDKIAQARAVHEASGMAILAKGPDTVLAGQRETVVFPPAPVWLSTAGTGDILAGIAASRLATHSAPSRAGIEAVNLHSEAARLCQPPFTASQLIGSIPASYGAFL